MYKNWKNFTARPASADRIAALQSAWGQVQLEVLVPATFTPTQWLALDAGNRNRRHKAFMRELPLPVARFKPEIATQLVAMANGTTNNLALETIAPALQHDFQKIGDTLTGKLQRWPVTIMAQTFEAPLTVNLHSDGSHKDREFLARLGALPFETINGAVLAKATTETKHLITLAKDREQHEQRNAALGKLRDQKILVPQALDIVYLIAPYRTMRDGREVEGTLHCSTDFKRPTPSVFVRA